MEAKMAELEKAIREQMQETQDTIDEVIAASERRQRHMVTTTIDRQMSVYFTLLGILFNFWAYVNFKNIFTQQ
jgi:hypothetical protein